MRKQYLLSVLIMALCIGGILSGCGKKDANFITYQNEQSGYTLEVPDTFVNQNQLEEKNQVLFVSENPPASLNIMMEVGGYNYYTPQELAEEMMNRLTADFTEKKEVNTQRITKGTYDIRIVYSGKNAAGDDVTLDLVILEPISGVHYYLLLTVPSKGYGDWDKDWQTMFRSFKVTKTEDEIYQVLRPNEEEKTESDGQPDGGQAEEKEQSPNINS